MGEGRYRPEATGAAETGTPEIGLTTQKFKQSQREMADGFESGRKEVWQGLRER